MVHAIGKAQHLALVKLLRLFAGMRGDLETLGGTRVPLLVRDGMGKTRAPALLVHGFGADKEGWLPMAAWMRRTRGLLIPDLPGFGAAGAIPKARATAKAQAKALVELLDRRGIQRAHIVGNSMGGGIALRLATDYPSRVASMTLMGSVGPIPVKSEVFQALDRGENPLLAASSDDLPRLMQLVMTRPPPTPRAMLRYLGAQKFAQRDAHAALFEGWTSAPDDHGVPTDLASVGVPALVVHGERDRVIDAATGRALAAELPNAQLALLSSIGHMPQMELPISMARRLDAFMASHD